ncbi:MAG: TIGR01906 family membrane protein [Chloroflexi bacterium]|nr:TIGR01906 family membrane protein [Chloroflexota bacterium]
MRSQSNLQPPTSNSVMPDEAATLPAALAGLRLALAIVFVLAVPIVLISTNVRWLTEDRALYLEGFTRYGAGARTGLSPAQLEQVAAAFITYFQGPPGRMDVQVELGGQHRPLFNERELAHMEDVQSLVRGFHTLQLVGGGVLLAIILVGFALWRRSFLGPLGWMALGGAGLTLGVLALAGALSVLDFQSLFTRFHLLSFRNDLWMLDPSRDYLIMLFPLGFWLDATLRLAFLAAVEAALVGAAGLGLLKLQQLMPPS